MKGDLTMFKDAIPFIVFAANKLKDTPCVIKCHDHFYCDNNFCKPRCDRFTWHSDSYNLIADTLIITSGCVGLICGLVVLIVFSIRYSTM